MLSKESSNKVPTFFFYGSSFELDCNLEDLPCTNILTSAYSFLYKDKGVLNRISEKRNSIDALFVDSGMISAWKNEDVSFGDAETQKKYVDELDEVYPDVIAHLDLPMEPKFLKLNGVSSGRALDKTVENAIFFDGLRMDATKCFCVQGWTLKEYGRCIDEFERLGLFIDENWVGIGTTCMRRPPDLYNVYSFCVDRIRKINPRQHIHAFGISRPKWIARLHLIGIDSFDSADISFATIFNNFYLPSGREMHIDLKPYPRKARKHLFTVNLWNYYLQLEKIYSLTNRLEPFL